ncbi:hypothetical protein GCM10027443_26390 [Pontibacter brevis]
MIFLFSKALFRILTKIENAVEPCLSHDLYSPAALTLLAWASAYGLNGHGTQCFKLGGFYIKEEMPNLAL